MAAVNMESVGASAPPPGAGLATHVLPTLPYGYADLEPVIDARTMALHHGKHHASYVTKLNAVLENFPDLQQKSATWLLRNSGKIPEAIRVSIRNNAGGHVNHSLFWQAMSPNGGGHPFGALADAIKQDFGSFEHLKERFVDAGDARFGAGWVWLVRSQKSGGQLQVITTSGHDNPLLQDLFPILLNDTWEHAYYLKHENRRADYLHEWWSVTNWQQAALRYANCFRSLQLGERRLESDSGIFLKAV